MYRHNLEQNISALHCVAVCCSVLQCVAVCCSPYASSQFSTTYDLKQNVFKKVNMRLNTVRNKTKYEEDKCGICVISTKHDNVPQN